MLVMKVVDGVPDIVPVASQTISKGISLYHSWLEAAGNITPLNPPKF
jgi:hypothetical protein